MGLRLSFVLQFTWSGVDGIHSSFLICCIRQMEYLKNSALWLLIRFGIWLSLELPHCVRKGMPVIVRILVVFVRTRFLASVIDSCIVPLSTSVSDYCIYVQFLLF